MSYAGSNIKAVLDRLSAAMGKINALGAAADLANMNGERIIWVPKSSAYARPHEQPLEGHAVAEEAITFSVAVFGADFESLQRLAAKLVSTGLQEFSENAFDPFAPAGSPYYGDVPRALGFVRTLPIVILLPVLDEVYLDGRFGFGGARGIVTNTIGENPSPIADTTE